MGHVLEVDNIVKQYGKSKKNSGAATLALAGVSFFVDAGEFVAIMGPSGSGKSTLLNCISTIDAPTSGSIRVAGRDVTKMRGGELAKFRRDQLGFIFQDSNLLDTLTVRENISLALTIQKKPTSEIPPMVNEIATRLGIAEILEQYPYQISGGQKQRAAAARALTARPAGTRRGRGQSVTSRRRSPSNFSRSSPSGTLFPSRRVFFSLPRRTVIWRTARCVRQVAVKPGQSGGSCGSRKSRPARRRKPSISSMAVR